MTNLPLIIQLLIYIIALVGGIYLLVKFSNIMIDASSAIAKKLHLSPFIIGLTVVAIGTSLPELAISVSDAVTCLISQGDVHANMAISNVIGSNIANVLLVLAVSVIMTTITVNKKTLFREMPMLLMTSALLVLFVCCFGDLTITRLEGLVLFTGIVLYFVYIIIDAKKSPQNPDAGDEIPNIPDMSWGKAIWLLLLGLAGVIAGGELVVFGAKSLALQGANALHWDHDLAETLVGLTVVAVGTSLPELVNSIVAAKKGANQMALGNVIGSNLFNSLAILGLSAIINPLTTAACVVIDVVVMFSAVVLVYIFCLSGKLRRWHGCVLLACYLGYITYLIIRTVI